MPTPMTPTLSATVLIPFWAQPFRTVASYGQRRTAPSRRRRRSAPQWAAGHRTAQDRGQGNSAPAMWPRQTMQPQSTTARRSPPEPLPLDGRPVGRRSVPLEGTRLDSANSSYRDWPTTPPDLRSDLMASQRHQVVVVGG